MLPLGASTFFTFGIVLVLLGANQAELARDLSLDLAASGFLGAVLALGLGVGVLVAGPLCDRFSRGPLYMGACALTAASLFAVSADRNYGTIVVLLLLIGFGSGSYDTVINASVVDRFRERTTSAIAIVHAAATFGACLGPVLVQLVSRTGHWSHAFHGLGVLHCGLAVWGFGADWGPRPVRVHRERAPVWRWIRSPALLALAVVAFAYVGAENGLTMFAVPWALGRAESESAGQWGISAFWFGLLIGRLFLAARSTERGLQLLAAGGLASGAALGVGSVVELGPLPLVTFLAGLAIGPAYPLLITLAAKRFPDSAGTAMGLVAGAGAVGGFAGPWIAGGVGDVWGVRFAVVVLAAHAVLIAVAAMALLMRDARSA